MSSHLVGSVLWEFMLLSGAAATTIFEAPPGHSSVLRGSEELGTLDAPFTTLEAAWMRSRSSGRAACSCAAATIFCRAHSRLMRATRTPDAPVVYRAYPGESPRIIGGLEIPATAFTPTKLPSGAPGGSGNLFDLGINETTLGGMSNPYISRKLELFYGGSPMTLARDPNIGTDPMRTWRWAGYENMSVTNSQRRPGKRRWRHSMPFPRDSSDVRQQRLPAYLDWLASVPEAGEGDDSTLSFTFKDANRGALWASALQEAAARNETSGLWLHGYWKFDWRDTYIKVSSISPNPVHDGSDSSGAPVAYSVTRDASTPPQYPWISGCRFYATNALSLLDQPGEYFVSKKTGTSISSPLPGQMSSRVQSSLHLAMSSLQNAHTHFVGITVSTSQSDAFVWRFWRTDRQLCGIERQVVPVHVWCRDASITRVVAFGCGASGVSVEGGDIKTLEKSNTSVLGCHISDFARKRRTYQPGIAFHGVGMRFANNTVRDAPHAGMTGGGNDLTFENNVLNRTVYECIDAGAFYVGKLVPKRQCVPQQCYRHRAADREAGTGELLTERILP